MITLESRGTGLLRIGDLARITGKTVRALHYYEELGLLTPVAHTKGGFRLYAQESIDRLRAIEKFQEIGMSLSDIQELSGIWHKSATGSEASERARQILRNKLAETEVMIQKLIATKEELATSLAVLDFCDPCKMNPQVGSCKRCATRGAHEHESVLVDAFCHGEDDKTTTSFISGFYKEEAVAAEKREQLI